MDKSKRPINNNWFDQNACEPKTLELAQDIRSSIMDLLNFSQRNNK